MVVPRARVRRDGEVRDEAADTLVPGDLVELQAGDTVPADVRLLDDAELAVDESVLTGESVAVSKSAATPVAPGAPLAERRTILYLGSAVVRGVGTGVVVATGGRTELGHISAMLAAASRPPTPLETALASFGRRVLVVCVLVTAGLFAWGVWAQGRPWHRVLLEAVSFAVAIIPEGLPAIATIVLALGTLRMARSGVIVRRLAAVETLGAATVICTDKTGTLTRNEMTVTEVWCDGRALTVEGVGFSPVGRVRGVEGDISAALSKLAEVGALCNDAALDERETGVKVLGDPTEGALVVLARKLGVDERALRRTPRMA